MGYVNSLDNAMENQVGTHSRKLAVLGPVLQKLVISQTTGT